MPKSLSFLGRIQPPSVIRSAPPGNRPPERRNSFIALICLPFQHATNRLEQRGLAIGRVTSSSDVLGADESVRHLDRAMLCHGMCTGASVSDLFMRGAAAEKEIWLAWHADRPMACLVGELHKGLALVERN